MAEPVPPGRAGRAWLRQRVAFAERSLELLDRKQVLVRRELADRAGHRETARRAWEAACADADRWGVRAAASGTARLALAAAAVEGTAAVDVPWCTTMGARHPGRPRCEPAVLPGADAAAGGPAVLVAAGAYRRALDAAVAVAALERSVQVLGNELAATERRRRAIEHRRLPSLRDALAGLELRLDELERDEQVATRWAARRAPGGAATATGTGTGPGGAATGPAGAAGHR